jgi:hypothetical protein
LHTDDFLIRSILQLPVTVATITSLHPSPSTSDTNEDVYVGPTNPPNPLPMLLMVQLVSPYEVTKTFSSPEINAKSASTLVSPSRSSIIRSPLILRDVPVASMADAFQLGSRVMGREVFVTGCSSA